MENYLQKLLINQQYENRLRDEKEQMLKRHEKELEEIDNRMMDIFHQRNLIIKEFQTFLDSNNNNITNVDCLLNTTTTNNNNGGSCDSTKSDSTGVFTNEPAKTIKIQASLNSAFKSIIHDSNTTADPVTNNQQQQSDQKSDSQATATIDNNNKESSSTGTKTSRTLKFIPRLKTSKSMGNMPATRTVPESPTSGQIEIMLKKVRENILDSNTLNKCIDLLSKVKDDPSTIQTSIKSVDDQPKNDESSPKTITDTPISPSKISKKPSQLTIKIDETISAESPSLSPVDQKGISKDSDKKDSTISNADSVNTKETKMAQPSTKKRYETPEERRKRIERVLFETPSRSSSNSNYRKFNKCSLSKSSTTLNELSMENAKSYNSNANSTSSTNRYSNRSKLVRNHSLSPLRFGALRRQKSEDPSTSPSVITSNQNSPKELREYKSEQQLFFEDSSMASFEEDSTNNDLSSEFDPEKCSLLQPEEEYDVSVEPGYVSVGELPVLEQEEDHLLAPSKVLKNKEVFKQIFFPQDMREKPLLSKEELAKIKAKKTMIKSKSIGWNIDSSNTDNDQSLRVDHLSHIRRSSSSPEQKIREKELNQLGNTGKFRCYQDFWENKTKELLERKKPKSSIKTVDYKSSNILSNITKSSNPQRGGQKSTGDNIALAKTEISHRKTNGNANRLNTAKQETNVNPERKTAAQIPKKEIIDYQSFNRKLPEVIGYIRKPKELMPTKQEININPKRKTVVQTLADSMDKKIPNLTSNKNNTKVDRKSSQLPTAQVMPTSIPINETIDFNQSFNKKVPSVIGYIRKPIEYSKQQEARSTYF